jgi:hypothetical protein
VQFSDFFLSILLVDMQDKCTESQYAQYMFPYDINHVLIRSNSCKMVKGGRQGGKKYRLIIVDCSLYYHSLLNSVNENNSPLYKYRGTQPIEGIQSSKTLLHL